MYNTFRYVIANEGVDSEEAYSFAGKVNHSTLHTLSTCQPSVFCD